MCPYRALGRGTVGIKEWQHISQNKPETGGSTFTASKEEQPAGIVWWASDTKWLMRVQESSSSALFLQPLGTVMPHKWQQNIFSSFKKLELPCGRVRILSQHSTLPPWLLQKWPPTQSTSCLPGQGGPLTAAQC